MLIAGRYRCTKTLGSGGMADVFEAVDSVRGERVALKQLRVGDGHGENAELRRTLFEREFHVLSQLGHPRVVSVLDYGVAELGPFYTMELLIGEDLAHASPVPWRRACAVMRDVSSVLSLLHSRRLVYRDLSPLNVFCSSDGVCKLIDFGALIPMGSADRIVGSPPFVSPEVVNRLLLDGRADLFSLGVTLHFALTGRFLFPASRFEELPLLWQIPPRPPSAFVEDIPPALDALVLELVQMDARMRPATAGEVIDRLEAIADLERNEQIVVARAYLKTPDLVERSAQLEDVKLCLRRAHAGHGTSVLVQGVSGSGRSRFLDACVLSAKLLGLTTLVTRAGDGQSGAYGAARSLVAQLVELDPTSACAAAEPHRALLGHIFPGLIASDQPVELARFDDPRALRPALQSALRVWFATMAQRRPLLIAVDDFNQLDEPSTALVALLAADAEGHPIAVIASDDEGPDASSPALSVLRRTARVLGLDALSEQGTRRLLASIFGDTTRLSLVASRVYAAAAGNPRDTLQLAQHLVDRRTIRWEAGVWTLPSALDVCDLPASATEALREHVSALGPCSLELARLLSLSRLPHLTLEEFLSASSAAAGDVTASLAELIEADLVSVQANAYRLNRAGLHEMLAAGINDDERRDNHRRLALMLARTGAHPFREIQHLRWSGQEEAALGRLVSFCAASQEQTAADPQRFIRLLEQLPGDWYELLDWGVTQLRAKHSAAASICALQGRMVGILPFANPHLGAEHIGELMTRLGRDSGLDIYEQLGPSESPMQRLQNALASAQRRFDATPELDRVLPPTAAIQQLAQVMIPAALVIATTYDSHLLRRAPSLEPLHPLSPALRVVSLVWQGLGERMSGRIDSAIHIYEQVVALLERPDRAGVAPSHAMYSRLGISWGLGMLRAMMGLEKCLEHAEVLKPDPWYRVYGILVQMLHAYWQADPARGDSEKERWMLCFIESDSRRWFDGVHLVAELTAHAMADDLERLKVVMADVAALADRAPGWRPVHDHALGEHHRIRGDLARAAACFERARTAHPPCEHQIWTHAACGALRVMVAQGRHADAMDAGAQWLESALQSRLGHLAHQLRIPLALAYARVGQLSRAVAMMEHVLVEYERIGVTGLNRGWAHETRAEIALLAADPARARQSLDVCVRDFRSPENPMGSRRCERLRDAIDASAASLASEDQAAHRDVMSTLIETAFGSDLVLERRAAKALELLLEKTGARGGLLRLLDDPAREAAEIGVIDDRDALGKLLEDVVQGISRTSDEALDFDTSTAIHASSPRAASGYALVMLQHQQQTVPMTTGVAILVIDPAVVFVDPKDWVPALSHALLGVRSARSR
jgi:hypothetical protein